jgi:hypothetical protein
LYDQTFRYRTLMVAAEGLEFIGGAPMLFSIEAVAGVLAIVK